MPRILTGSPLSLFSHGSHRCTRIKADPKAGIATKNHEDRAADETLKAPMGAREIPTCKTNSFCAFLWPKPQPSGPLIRGHPCNPW